MRNQSKLVPNFFYPLVLIFVMASCDASRKIYKAKSDSTVVAKSDSGAVNKITSTDTKANDWWRETIVFPQAKDCTINNYYNTTTPAIIMREGGSQTHIVDNTKYDSGWKQKYDSLQFVSATTDKKTEVEVLSFWQIVGIGLACSLVVGVVIFLLSKFKISLR